MIFNNSFSIFINLCIKPTIKPYSAYIKHSVTLNGNYNLIVILNCKQMLKFQFSTPYLLIYGIYFVSLPRTLKAGHVLIIYGIQYDYKCDA